jgi:hypothetical protein
MEAAVRVKNSREVWDGKEEVAGDNQVVDLV